MPVFIHIDDPTEEIRSVEAQLGEMVKKNEDVYLLMSVPGIGYQYGNDDCSLYGESGKI